MTEQEVEIRIKRPSPKDYSKIANVINSEINLYKKIYSQKILDAIGIGKISVKDLKKGSKNRKFLIAIKNKKIVGFASWHIKPNNVAWISMLQVLPEYHKRGMGHKLILEIERQAKNKKCFAVALEMQRKAFWALNFYKKNNYKIISDKKIMQGIYAGTLLKKPVKNTFIFGKELIH